MNLLEVVEKYKRAGKLVSFRGQEAYVTEICFKKNELPGLEVNYIRAENGDPATIEAWAWVNRMGTIITERPIPFECQDNGQSNPNYLILTKWERELFAEILL